MAEVVAEVVPPQLLARSEIRNAISDSKFVIIGGAGLTGKAAAKYFSKLGKDTLFVVDGVVASDRASKIFNLDDALQEISLRGEKGIALFSPGISPSGKIARAIFKAGLKSVSELDLLCEKICEPLVAVTGTNGKSTTTTLVYEILKASGVQADLIGNIGIPFVDALNLHPIGVKRNFISEISSYQLEWCDKVSPQISIFLNLADNHLERHLTIENYLNAKLKILSNQPTDGWAIINADDPLSERIVKASSGRVIKFGVSANGRQRSQLSKDGNQLEILTPEIGKTFSLNGAKLLGFHNRMNFAAAIPAAILAGATDAGVYEVIGNFSGLEHRLEFVPNNKGFKIINDSKATTAHAAAADLNAVLDSTEGSKEEVVLLVGGLEKIGSWKSLATVIKNNPRAKSVLFFGKDGKEILSQIEAEEVRCELKYIGSLSDTVKHAVANAKKNSLILFSPGCPSFDAYSGFEERGRHFKTLISEFAV